MGTFAGHLIPGSIFLILSFWWTYSAWLRYFVCRQRHRSYYVSLSFPLHCCGSRAAALPIESVFIIIGTSIGIITELGAGFHLIRDANSGQMSFYVTANGLQHVATYTMFFLVGVIDLLIHYRTSIPRHLDIVAVNLAFSAEAISFYFHGHGRSPVETQLHVLLALAICATVVCGIFEIVQHEKQIYATLMRAYCTFLQGSWFYTIAFFLYSPFHAEYDENKDLDRHRTLMLISYYFVIHMAIGLFVLLLLALPSYCVSIRNRQAIDYGYITIMTNDNDDDDQTEMGKLNETTIIHSDTRLVE
jgi:hypothetical protein